MTAPAPMRWSPNRKADVLRRIRSGELSVEAACLAFDLSVSEIEEWTRSFDRNGLGGLSVTRLQSFRKPRSRDAARGSL